MTDFQGVDVSKPTGKRVLRSGHSSGCLPTRPEALAALGPVIYAVRIRGMLKIGFTANLHQRIESFGHCDLLAVKVGVTRQDETAIHTSLAGHAVTGREWYALDDPAVLDVVDGMRHTLGLPALAA